VPGPAPIPVVVDCDPGHDDAVALVLADVHADLLGITTVGGNAPLAAVTRNALVTTERFAIGAEVHAGAERPLVGPPRSAPAVHGEDGFGGLGGEPERQVASRDGVGFLVETARRVEGLWLIACGPLTNVALALRTAPDVARRLAGISFMAGGMTAVDQRGSGVGEEPNVDVGGRLDVAVARSVVLDALARRASGGVRLRRRPRPAVRRSRRGAWTASSSCRAA
jgi:inosine-uridine nucleoside N-ribohydrolase